MPPLAEGEQRVELPPFARALAGRGRNAVAGLLRALAGGSAGVARGTAFAQLFVTLLPALALAGLLGVTYRIVTAPVVEADTTGLVQAGGLVAAPIEEKFGGLIGEPPSEEPTGLGEPPAEGATGLAPPPGAVEAKPAAAKKPATAATPAGKPAAGEPERRPAPSWFWIFSGICAAATLLLYLLLNWERLQVFKMLLTSFFPLALLILAVLGSIVFGLATPTEAAAVGAFGGFVLAAVYRFMERLRPAATRGRGQGSAIVDTVKEMGSILKESSFLTAKTSAMVCWLFVGSAIFSAAFALLGGQEVVEKWVLSLNMTPVQFLILSQFIIFILGWPLEWTEIIVIFMPIFIPLLAHFNIDPLFFGLLVALNLQTAFLSPPVAMAAFYLKGVSPPHVTLTQIFAGMLPFMGIQVVAIVLLYVFPQIGLWLPQVLYSR
jgi:TRAP-type mannitol/chloroaromatic compound transport system permease large subunit